MRMNQQAETDSSKAAKNGNGIKHVEFQKSLTLSGKWDMIVSSSQQLF